jgi:flagellar transcriptional activator FlhC
MLTTIRCTRCNGHFIGHAYELERDYVCGLCEPPARAGKARRAGAIH